MVERELELLEQHGHQVKVVYESNDKIQGLEKILTAVNSAHSSSFQTRAFQIISDFRPDIVHIHNFFPLITPSIFDACREAKTPSVITLHNYRLFCANGLFLREGKICDICLHGSPYQSVIHGCYQGSMLGTYFVARMQKKHQDEGTWKHKVDKFIAITQFAKSLFTTGGIPEERISVKSNFGPDLSKYSDSEKDFYVYFGRLSPEKGIQTLLKAWKDLPLKLLLIGDDSSNMAEKNSNPNIQFLGKSTQSDAWKKISQARGMIFPTECFEGGFPSVLVEALSIGAPIIASRIGGIPEFLSHEKNGLLFTPGNAASLRETILQLEADIALRRRLRLAARETYLSLLTPDQGYSALLSIYQEAIAHYKSR